VRGGWLVKAIGRFGAFTKAGGIGAWTKNKLKPNVIESLLSSSAFNGELYPVHKLEQLVKYLERRGVSVYGAIGDGNPKFVVFNNGKAQILLPERPTKLQVKHELSHYLDGIKSV
jgi:hypothetical protein